ncbi:hypothetical protein SEA_COMRADE_151 [Streptomyces phage Comrade]|uniref:Uncharacterized protein n=2 Tax=Gilsonvirus comrade TaxID=2846395 RepID=A0A385DXG7_9CAUD|nr:hypothetical protein HWB84_gp118 [Streptomyces phage Comrade]AXQ63397.1 hypothetical protein SEA_COMRADE_151 [Streptomyces phage Comrade]QQO39816.1 hypothetical protein SEA_BELFORT_154 [Streptomyces phage Belfort]QZE11723.1 hypothetical protein SEA_KARP_148 [Streptomyces phage Karp]UTN92385.1 hypothetical protein SEA_STIGMA_152 [Streptomyces phage Stigma]
MARKVANETPVRVHDPRQLNAAHRNKLGIIKDSEKKIGGVWSYKVKLNNGPELWFDEGELRVLKNT